MPFVDYCRKARRALSTASTITPTSAKTAIHMEANPKVASMSTSTLTPVSYTHLTLPTICSV